METSTDVLIIGAGITGLTLANALASSDLTITLVDARANMPTFCDATYDARVSAITKASQQILQHLDVWQAICEARISPYQHMHVWDATGTGTIDFNAADIGELNLGHIVENNLMQQVLHERLQAFDNVTLLQPCQLTTLSTQNNAVCVSTANHNICAKLVVGADGAHSWLKQQAGVNQYQRAYGHTAIVATIETEKSHQRTAWQRFMPKGPLALLPLSCEQHCSIVWSSESTQAQTLLSLDPAPFATAIANAFEHHLGDVKLRSERYHFPLIMRHNQHYVLPNMAFIGDAAHTIHPLAGQGLNLGLLDAASLAQTILTAHAKQRDIGSLQTLRHYARWRKGYNWGMIAAMDGFKTLFSNDNRVLTPLRNQGLSLTNRLPWLKNYIMQYAMGLKGDLPNLAARKN